MLGLRISGEGGQCIRPHTSKVLCHSQTVRPHPACPNTTQR